MADALVDDPETYEATEDEYFYHAVEALDHEEGAYANAWFAYKYNTYQRSNEEICFTGDFYPYMSPSCYL